MSGKNDVISMQNYSRTVCVCVCVYVGRGEEVEEVETEGGLREMPISMGNSIWQLHGDKPISMDCQGVLYELATCPL